MRGSPEWGYFILACVWSGRWADFESYSRIGACTFRCFCRKVVFVCMKNTTSCRKVVLLMHEHTTVCRSVTLFYASTLYCSKKSHVFLCMEMLLFAPHPHPSRPPAARPHFCFVVFVFSPVFFTFVLPSFGCLGGGVGFGSEKLPPEIPGGV